MRDPDAPKDKQIFDVSFDETTWSDTKRCGDGDTWKHGGWKDWKDFGKEKAEKKPESGKWKEHHAEGNANAAKWNEKRTGNKAQSGTWKDDSTERNGKWYKKDTEDKAKAGAKKREGETLAADVAKKAKVEEETKQKVLERRQARAESAARELLLNHAAAAQKVKK